MGFENFEPIFGEAKVEWATPNCGHLHRFLYHVFAPDASRLRFYVSDFSSSTWEAVRSLHQLEDMRDIIGIGGTWSDFIDYLTASIKSEDVKLVLEGQPKSDGAASAKLVAQKTKGMPRISISLSKLVGSASTEANANLSLGLFKAFKSTENLLIREQELSCQLTKLLSAEKEKNENIQSQLDSVLSSKRQKLQKMKSSDKAVSSNGLESSPDKRPAQDMGSTKVINRVVPAHRRTKVRGALLQDTEGD